MDESAQSTEQSSQHVPGAPFQRGNKLAHGGKRPGSGRKSLHQQAITESVKLTAREIVRGELDKHVSKVMQTYIRLATSGRDPTTTRHAIDKIDPDEHVTAPTVTINFVMFNPSSSGNDARPIIDVSSSSPSSPVSPSPAPTVTPGLTFIDIVEK